MPHLIFELSENVLEQDNFPAFFQECHKIVAETLAAELATCKSRAVIHKHYLLGDDKNTAFVHLNLRALGGRTPEQLQKAGDQLMILLRQRFADSIQKSKCEITIELSELRQPYFKFKP